MLGERVIKLAAWPEPFNSAEGEQGKWKTVTRCGTGLIAQMGSDVLYVSMRKQVKSLELIYPRVLNESF